MDNYKEILINEFNAGDNSFLLDIRCNINFDKNKLLNLLHSAYYYCLNFNEDKHLDRFFASGFWYISHFVKDWTSHENFREKNILDDDYYEKVYEIIYDLSFWYFMNESPYMDKEELLRQIDDL